ncbi:MAG: transcription factor S [Candidatus Pacearchaeota archaeon]
MEFCPKCGAVLIKKTKNFGCPRCNYSTKDKVKLSSSEKVTESKEVAVVKGKEINTEPVIAENCKKCGNNQAYFWTIQTRAGDEAETKFFRCTDTKCGYTWREYR